MVAPSGPRVGPVRVPPSACLFRYVRPIENRSIAAARLNSSSRRGLVTTFTSCLHALITVKARAFTICSGSNHCARRPKGSQTTLPTSRHWTLTTSATVGRVPTRSPRKLRYPMGEPSPHQMDWESLVQLGTFLFYRNVWNGGRDDDPLPYLEGGPSGPRCPVFGLLVPCPRVSPGDV